jgi:molecular chaperone DnaK (HSP70)
MGIVIGIDFGTTNSVVSYMKDGKKKTVKFGRNIAIPSAVYFKNEHECLFGYEAIIKGRIIPRALVTSFKPRIADSEKRKIVTEDGSFIERSYKEIAKLFINYLIDRVNRKLLADYGTDADVSDAVITVPVKFNPVQKEAVKWAAGQSKIKCKLAAEPTAAAFAYNSNINAEEKLLIYDFGGGTFDVSIMKTNALKELKFIGSGGDVRLGGDLITERIVKEYLSEYIEEMKVDMPLDPADYDPDDCPLSETQFFNNLKSIYDIAEKIKIGLSNSKSITETLSIVNDKDEELSIELEISRVAFEDFIKKEIERTVQITKETLQKYGETPDNISRVILAGGSSAIPLVRKKLAELFLDKQIYSDGNEMTLISLGAAILADSSMGGVIESNEMQFDAIGVKAQERGRLNAFHTLIDINQPLPCRSEKIYALANDYQQELNIELYAWDKQNYPDASQTMDDGIQFIDRLSIYDIPKHLKNEIDIRVIFEIQKDGTMQLDVSLSKKDGTPLKSEKLKIERSSNVE